MMSWRLVISENAAGHERTRTALEPISATRAYGTS